jgi:regulator of RNase E activity RraA
MEDRMKASKTEREDLLAAYEDLRVADVRDGMDIMMMHRVGSMGPHIRPLWRTRTCGIAMTCRYVPYQGAIPAIKPGDRDEYWKWAGWYYSEVCKYPWAEEIQPGDFCVIDISGVNTGLMGSMNALAGVQKGARGYVTSDGVRDTDEIILERIPFWSAYCSQNMVQGWIQYESRNIPVEVGGVLVNPGDVVVADGDGVIIVPRAAAFEVARHARIEHENDKVSRKKLYKALGMKPDETVKARRK